MNTPITRRKLLKVLGYTAASIPVANILIKPDKVYALEVSNVALDPALPKAVQFGYAEDATKVDVVKFPKRAGDVGSKQFCSSCQLLVKNGLDVAGKPGKYGTCTLFTEGLVTEAGWCNMWIQKVG